MDLRPFLTIVLMLASAAAAAQGLPVPLPALPAGVGDRVAAPLERTAGTVADLRREANRRLLRTQREWVEDDGRGNPAVRGELLAVAPTPAALAAARAAGFRVRPAPDTAGLGLQVVVLEVPAGMRASRALRRLRRLDPDGTYDFNHLYLGSGGRADPATPATAPADLPVPARVGLVDGGVAAAHPALAAVRVSAWGCGGKVLPSAHGTAVASLLAGPGTQLFAADIVCDRPAGGAVSELAAAFAWLHAQHVAVINLSLVGPPNLLLERLVATMQQRGHVLVAAAGNDGPAAAPLYPAAYPDVIGVAGVDDHDRLLPESARGAQVDFAAPGSGLFAATLPAGVAPVRGSSFAAPLVARLAAQAAPTPQPGLAQAVTATLATAAVDAGRRGRDDRFGHGLLFTGWRHALTMSVNAGRSE